MRILAASVTNAQQEVLYAHLSCLLKQKLEDHVNVDYLYVVDPAATTKPEDVLNYLGIPWIQGTPKPQSAQYTVDEFTHNWTKDSFYWLGEQKQRLIEYAKVEKYDYLFLCDSDLLLGPNTLRSLLGCKKEIVSGNFWTKWTPQAPALPQVWQEHPYEFQGRGWEAHEHLTALAKRQLIPVGGLGACTLISAEGLKRARYWPPLEALPQGSMWQGEDRTFSITAQRKHVPLYADGWPDIFHCYRPSDVERIPEIMGRFKAEESRRSVQRGDLVSAVLTPVEMPSSGEKQILGNFEYHLRGRLGEMKIIPSLEEALLGMTPGTDKFVKLRFPEWYEIREYAGQTRTIQLKVIDVKQYSECLGLQHNDFSVLYA